MMTTIVISLASLFALITLGIMLHAMKKAKADGTLMALDKRQIRECSALAIIAFIADTIGVGSYAVVIAGTKFRKLLPDEWLPGLTNGAQLIPGIVESFLFLHVIHVQPTLLITLVVGACLGGIVGGLVFSRLNQHYLQVSMFIAFVVMAIALFCNQIGWLHIAGTAQTLHGTKLILGFLGMMLAGMLTCVGVGIYGVIEIVLLLLGLSPWIAFPIMTTAGAMQQSFATSTLTFAKRVPLKASILMTFVGVIGVLAAVPMVTHLSINKLHWLLLLIIIYNALMMLRALKKRHST
jgi:uncharacterized membrane protein YfcA